MRALPRWRGLVDWRSAPMCCADRAVVGGPGRWPNGPERAGQRHGAPSGRCRSLAGVRCVRLPELIASCWGDCIMCASRRQFLRALGVGGVALTGLTALASVRAQEADADLRLTELRDGLLLLTGAGCNVVARKA